MGGDRTWQLWSKQSCLGPCCDDYDLNKVCLPFTLCGNIILSPNSCPGCFMEDVDVDSVPVLADLREWVLISKVIYKYVVNAYYKLS